MKKLIFTLCLMAMTTAAIAVPAKRGTWKTITRTDGTQVRVELRGDEHLHYWQDADGTRYQQAADGSFLPIEDMAQLSQRASLRRAKADNARRETQRRIAQRKVSYTGKKRGLIILVQFTNKKFQSGHDQALYNNVANTRGFSNSMGFNGSVADYFYDQSEGQFELEFDVVGPVSLNHSYSYYGENDAEGDDRRPGQMIKDACNAVDAEVNFADYDWDGDGYVDQVFVLYAGEGEHASNDTNTIWPHEWDLTSATGSSLRLDGVRINTYACSNEMASSTQIEGIGTICHEFSHCLGLPDFYDTEGSNFGMDCFSLMDYGSYLGDGFVPCGYTSYERMVCGWKQPIELKESTSVTDMKALTDGGASYIIRNGNHSDEFYLLENRQPIGWDRSLYTDLEAKGMLILHVDYDESAWENNSVNVDASHQRCTVIHADNKDGAEYYTDLKNDFYPYGELDSLTNYSLPAATVYNRNTDGSRYMNCVITGITQNDDGTMAFKYNYREGAPESETTGNTALMESFSDCNGKGGNDNQWSGNVASAKIAYDLEGWEAETIYGGYQCARVGSSKNFGYLITPELSLDGEYTMSFKAAPWGEESNFMRLETVSGSATLSTQTFDEMQPKQWNNHELTIKASSTVRLRIMSNKNRFFIDEICIKPVETATGIVELPATAAPAAAAAIYHLDGRYAGTDLNALSRGIYVVGGKKVVKR